MRVALVALLMAMALCVSGCEGPTVKSNTENVNMVVVPHNSKDMQKAVDILKENMVFFKVKNKCFGCVFTVIQGRAVPSFVDVSCEGLE